MDFLLLQVFTNYVDAHIVMGRLNEEGINCWLKDENIVTLGPLLTNAVGGIKLMVAATEFEMAKELLVAMETEKKQKFTCPQCNSSDIQMITTPRKLSNWLGTLVGFLLMVFPLAANKVWHCFNCKAEFKYPVENENF